jgi:hypothetical protein
MKQKDKSQIRDRSGLPLPRSQSMFKANQVMILVKAFSLIIKRLVKKQKVKSKLL